MSRNPRKSRNKTTERGNESNLGRKFRIFVKPVDEFGFPDEERFGWLCSLRGETVIQSSWRNAIVFEEKEEGHGSFSDWKRFLEEDHRDWKISPPSYLTQESDSQG